jgi:hypothetical protein
MIERLVLVKKSLLDALNFLNLSSIFREDEFKLLEDILKVLEPLKLAIEELSKRESI